MKLKKKNNEIMIKYINTPQFGKLTSEDFAARLKQLTKATKDDIAADFVKRQILIENQEISIEKLLQIK